MIKSITNCLIIFFIFQQLQSQISSIDKNGYNPFCEKSLHNYKVLNTYEAAFFYKISSRGTGFDISGLK